jgi:hypothetical protein
MHGNRKEIKYEINEEGCWICTSHKCCKNERYPRLMIKYKRYQISRIMLEKSLKIKRKNFQVLHKCDNPLCINPEHLFYGTINDNMVDKIQKGRQAQGISSGRAKLSVEKVKFMRSSNESNKYFANLFKVSTGIISRSRNGITWKSAL